MSVDCVSCAEVFQSGLTGIALQVCVDEKFPRFQCEKCQVSSYSPGPVVDEEKLVFLTIHPIHFDQETGTLSAIAFEQLTRNDLSMLRRNHFEYDLPTTLAGLQSLGKGDRSIDFCCVVRADEIRDRADESGRVLGVYDTALPDKKSHASIFVRKDYLGDKAARQRARLIAHKLFKDRMRRLADLGIGSDGIVTAS